MLSTLIDVKKFWLESGNFQGSSQKCQPKALSMIHLASLHIYTFYSEKRRVHTSTNCAIPLAETKEKYMLLF